MAKAFSRAIAAIALIASAPLAAQVYGDSYTFLKAVKDRDGNKATSLVSEPGTTVINARDRGSGDGALHYVARDRDFRWLGFLLDKGARPDLQNNGGDTALGIAAQIGWLDGAQLLLSKRASVDLANSRGETPLILAVQKRDVAMVRLLLSAGANPKKADNVTGKSALDYARQDVRAGAILKLLEAPPAPVKATAGPKL